MALKMARDMADFSPLVLKTLKRFVTEGAAWRRARPNNPAAPSALLHEVKESEDAEEAKRCRQGKAQGRLQGTLRRDACALITPSPRKRGEVTRPGSPHAMQGAELVAVGIAQIGDVELHARRLRGRCRRFSRAAAPWARPAAWNASACRGRVGALKPSVPPLAKVAGLPSIGFDTEKVPVLVR